MPSSTPTTPRPSRAPKLRLNSAGSISNHSTPSSSSTTSPRFKPIQLKHTARLLKDAAHSAADATSAQDIFLFLVAFRLLNAMVVRTFFQPDEFFQSLEPAWEMVFGKGSGAWITWEWRYHLRSAIHPAVFAAVYSVANTISRLLRLSPLMHADLMIAAPRAMQAVCAAVGDFYTWKLAGLVYGIDSRQSWTLLFLTVLSPWLWFCSTRTFSNSLETTLTVTALYYWPWEWSILSRGYDEKKTDAQRQTVDIDASPVKKGDAVRLRICLSLAALACILRPTNLIIWLCLSCFTVLRSTSNGWLAPARWPPLKEVHELFTTQQKPILLTREAAICGSVVLALGAVVDRLYFQTFTFPPLKFLYFNIAQSLAVFYGRNDWHYYLSQGYPLLLLTALPFGLLGLYQALRIRLGPCTDVRQKTRFQLGVISVVLPLVLSVISHKEVRFIYPILPALHILSAKPLVSFFQPAISAIPGKDARPYLPRLLLLIFLILVNIFIAVYTSMIHAVGPLDVLTYLREQHATYYIPTTSPRGTSYSSPSISTGAFAPAVMTVGFLMPCHSTPWRSHLIFPTIQAWALSCEPPVNFNASAKATYLDEADQFYANPSTFLRENMVGGLRRAPRRAYTSLDQIARPQGNNPPRRHNEITIPEVGGVVATSPNDPIEWPTYLAFFGALEPSMHALLGGSAYRECWRGWSTAWHDDDRRRGDVVVWCLDKRAQGAWDEKKRSKDVKTKAKAIAEDKKKRGNEKVKENKVKAKQASGESSAASWFKSSGSTTNNAGISDSVSKAWSSIKMPSLPTSKSSSWLSIPSYNPFTSNSASKWWPWGKKQSWTSWGSGSSWELPWKQKKKSRIGSWIKGDERGLWT